MNKYEVAKTIVQTVDSKDNIEAITKEDNSGISIINKVQINSQKDFDRTVLNWEPIVYAICGGGFDSLLQKIGITEPGDFDVDKIDYALRSAFDKDEVLFPNLYSKFKYTGFINIQSEEDVIQIYKKSRWDLLTDKAKNTPITELWDENNFFDRGDVENESEL